MSAWKENRLGLVTVAGVALLNMVVVGMVAMNGPAPPATDYSANNADQPNTSLPAHPSPPDPLENLPRSTSTGAERQAAPATDPRPSETPNPDSGAPSSSGDTPAGQNAEPGTTTPADGASATDPAAGSTPPASDGDKPQDPPIVIPIPPDHHDAGDGSTPGGTPASDGAARSSDGAAKPSSDMPAASAAPPSDSGAGDARDPGKR